MKQKTTVGRDAYALLLAVITTKIAGITIMQLYVISIDNRLNLSCPHRQVIALCIDMAVHDRA